MTPSSNRPPLSWLAALVAVAVLVAASYWRSVQVPAAADDGSVLPGQLLGEAPPPPGYLDASVASLQDRLSQRPDDARAYSLLGAAFLQKARETGDPAFYQQAEQALQSALARQPEDADTLITLGALALARHQFQPALELGQQARALNPYSARALGVIVDAQVELGAYAEAVYSTQAMVDLRPDLASYARTAYLRELYGDTSGALSALRLARQAAGGLNDNVAWVQHQIGQLQFSQGDLEGAQISYAAALNARPDFAPAQAGLARLLAARGDWEGAIAAYERLAAGSPVVEYSLALADCYLAVGQPERAEQQYVLAQGLIELEQANGVDMDLELVLFEADHPQRQASLDPTLARARRLYERRPTIYSADALAWTLYQMEQASEAQFYAEQALRLNTQDALLWFHAGLIDLAAGDPASARARLERALAINPHFSLLWSRLAQETLAGLTASQ